MKEKYLPLGTVVTLNGGTKKIMIIGYCPMTKEKQVFDYSACLYPEGVLSSDKNLVFNHDQIATINYLGLESDEYKQMDTNLKTALKQVSDLKDVKLPGMGDQPNLQNTPQNNTQVNPQNVNQNNQANVELL